MNRDFSCSAYAAPFFCMTTQFFFYKRNSLIPCFPCTHSFFSRSPFREKIQFLLEKCLDVTHILMKKKDNTFKRLQRDYLKREMVEEEHVRILEIYRCNLVTNYLRQNICCRNEIVSFDKLYKSHIVININVKAISYSFIL